MLRLVVDSFDGTTTRDPRSIIALFYATWCPFCTRYLREFEKSMQERASPIGALVDISDMSDPLWERFHVEIVPTLIAFRDRKIFTRKDGVAGVGLGVRDLEEMLREMQ